jgi:hypothetical protein
MGLHIVPFRAQLLSFGNEVMTLGLCVVNVKPVLMNSE